MKRKTTSPGPRYAALIQLLRTAEELWNASRVFFAGSYFRYGFHEDAFSSALDCSRAVTGARIWE